MRAFLLICAVQVIAGVGSLVLLARRRPAPTRGGALLTLACLLPLVLLGLVPSAYTVMGLVVVPAVVLSVVGIVRPPLLFRPVVRTYLGLALALAAGGSGLQAFWLSRCHELEVVVPEDFAGEVRLVRDQGGVDLRSLRGALSVPASGEVRVRDDGSFFRCCSVHFRSPSGRMRIATDRGVLAGGPANGLSSTDLDGTTYLWEVSAR